MGQVGDSHSRMRDRDQASILCDAGEGGGRRVAGCIFHFCDKSTVTVNIWQLQRRAHPWSDEWRVPYFVHEHGLRWQWVGPDLRRHPWTKGPAEEAAGSPVPPVIIPAAMKPGEWFVERQPPGACDEDGWQYAGDFLVPTTLWTPTLSWHTCRRRLWKCRLRREAVERLEDPGQFVSSGGDDGLARKQSGDDSNTSTQAGVKGCVSDAGGDSCQSECGVDDVESQILDMMAQVARVRTSVSALADLGRTSGTRQKTAAEKVIARIFKCDQILGDAALKAESGDICGSRRTLFNAGKELKKIKSAYAAAAQGPP
mmetsp:Transcript_75905/g.214655  ORF Transcript_75905/g.214655 Transcript_75905/m.214655 type:complete len:313 (-) Transcript_75905:227-1165(-)